MSGLEELLANATPGPWANYMGPDVVRKNDYSALRLAIFDSYDDPPGPQTDGEANARLAALAPDLARLALDMGEALRGIVAGYDRELASAIVPLHGVSVYVSATEADRIGGVLARLDGLAAGKGYIGSGGRVVPDLMLEEQRAGKETAE